MTYREFYQAVIENCNNTEAQDFAKKHLEKLENRKLESLKENEKYFEKLDSLLTDEFKLASYFADNLDITTSKITYLLKHMEGVEREQQIINGRAVYVYRREQG